MKISANSMHIGAQFVIGAALYLLLAFLFVRYAAPDASVLLVVLVAGALRLCLAFVEWGIECLAWALVGRRARVQEMIRYFEGKQFPRRPERVGVQLYLTRLADGDYDDKITWPDEEQISRMDLKDAARSLHYDLETSPNMRSRQVVEAAFDRYSPLE